MAGGGKQIGSKVRGMRRLPSWWIALAILLVLPQPALGAVGTGARVTRGADLKQVIGLVAAMGDRSTGSRGCAKTADFIYKTFEELGLEEVGRHRYLLPVMRYQEASLTLLDRKLT